jgi:hypothetical protein
MEIKHTPGPWTLGDENNYGCEVEIGETVCSMTRDTKMSERYVISRDEMLANAHLIMAAPDMLDVLKQIIQTIEKSDHWWIADPNRGGFDVENIEEAIKKATYTVAEQA